MEVRNEWFPKISIWDLLRVDWYNGERLSTTWHQITEESNPSNSPRDNLKFQNSLIQYWLVNDELERM
jgi:hypothetical protein